MCRAVAVALWPFRIALPLGKCELEIHSSTVQTVEMGTTKLPSAEDMASILWTPEDIARRVTELGGAISRDFSGQSIAVVGVSTNEPKSDKCILPCVENCYVLALHLHCTHICLLLTCLVVCLATSCRLQQELICLWQTWFGGYRCQ